MGGHVMLDRLFFVLLRIKKKRVYFQLFSVTLVKKDVDTSKKTQL